MTVLELSEILNKAIKDNYGHANVYFDTEAKSFEYHLAYIKHAFLEPEIDPDEPLLILYE